MTILFQVTNGRTLSLDQDRGLKILTHVVAPLQPRVLQYARWIENYFTLHNTQHSSNNNPLSGYKWASINPRERHVLHVLQETQDGHGIS